MLRHHVPNIKSGFFKRRKNDKKMIFLFLRRKPIVNFYALQLKQRKILVFLPPNLFETIFSGEYSIKSILILYALFQTLFSMCSMNFSSNVDQLYIGRSAVNRTKDLCDKPKHSTSEQICSLVEKFLLAEAS